MALVPNPTALDFGNVPVNTSSVLPVALTNDGTATAHVTATLINAPFTAVMIEPCIDSQATKNVDVRFTPTRAGIFAATLTVRWNIGGVGQTDVTVSCRGIGV